MAKIRVAQIHNLDLTEGTNGFAALKVGSETATNVMTSLTEVTANTTENTVLTSLTASGNTITPEYKSFAQLGLYTKEEVNTRIANDIKTAIEALDTQADVTIASVANGVVTLKPGIAQVDGKIQQGTGADITLDKVATTGAAVDVAIADNDSLYKAENVEAALAEVMTKVNSIEDAAISVEGSGAIKVEAGAGENADTVKTVSLAINSADKVLTQSIDGLLVNLGLTWGDNNDNKITLTGKDGVEIASIDASKFIKDGMLEDVELADVVVAEDGAIKINGTVVAEGESTQGITKSGKYFKFTWNTYTYNESGEATKTTKVEYLNVETLVDAYKAGNDWIVIDETANTISHKKVDGLDIENTHGIVEKVTVNGTESQTFNVPTLKVDAAGHVISVDEKTVTIDLPDTINTAVQTVTSEEELNTTDKFVAVHATTTGTDVELTSEVEIQEIASATAEDNGLATALDVKNYVDNNASTLMIREVLEVSDINGVTTLSQIPIGDVVITQNGIDLDFGEYLLDGNEGRTVVFNIDSSVDVKDGDVFIAYYMYNPNQRVVES